MLGNTNNPSFPNLRQQTMSLAYWGSKRRFAREIADVVCAHASSTHRDYYEPFCGMASVGVEVLRRGCFVGHKVWSDASPDVVAYWRGLQRGWLPSGGALSQTQWDGLRRERTASPRRSFYGFHLGYGGQFLAGRSPNADLNRPAPMQRVRERLKATAALLQSQNGRLVIEQRTCDAVRPRKHSVVYCDPPYVLEEGKPNSNRKHVDARAMDAIWKCLHRWVVDDHCIVYLSASRQAPARMPVSLRLVLVKEWTVLNRMQQSKRGVAHYRKELLFRVERAGRRPRAASAAPSSPLSRRGRARSRRTSPRP